MHPVRDIDGVRFRVRMLECEDAEDCLFDIFRMLGPTLAEMLGKAEGKGMPGLQSLLEKEVNWQLGVRVLGELSSSLDKQTYHAVCERLIAVSEVSLDGGKTWPALKTVQSETFRGKIMLKWRWLAFALEVNFSGFFGDISRAAGLAAQAVAEAKQRLKSPQVSAGASGAS